MTSISSGSISRQSGISTGICLGEVPGTKSITFFLKHDGDVFESKNFAVLSKKFVPHIEGICRIFSINRDIAIPDLGWVYYK